MEKVRYMISDAANMVQVEQHVLRYWEEELQLDVPRNEMGHRYYTDENIKEFLKVKELKEKGYQLKAIRMYLKSEKQREKKNQEKQLIENPGAFITMTNGKELGMKSEKEVVPSISEQRSVKMEQFQALMTEIVKKALESNNEMLSNEVGEHVLKEMNYLMRENDQLQEERYRKIDALIRGKKIKEHSEKKSRGLWKKQNKKGTQ